MDKRTEAIQQFVEMHALEENAITALKTIFQQKPRALLIAWESPTGVGVTSVPFSVALVHGLLGMVTEMIDSANAEDEEEEEEEDDAVV